MLIRLSLAFKNYETSINQGPKSKCQNLLNVNIYIYIYIYVYIQHTYIYIYIYIYVCNISKYIYIYIYNLYIYRQSLSRIIFDLCGFSGAGLEITFGLRVMDSMTQLWCQKVGFLRLFCVILRHFASYLWSFQMWLTEGRSLLFSPDQKNAVFGCAGIYI